MYSQCLTANCKKAKDWSCLSCLYATKQERYIVQCILDLYINAYIDRLCTNSSKYLLILLHFVMYMSGESYGIYKFKLSQEAADKYLAH